MRVGQDARLSFEAFDSREVPPVPGEVQQVSADRLKDERTGELYYLVRLSFSSKPVGNYDPGKIGPGQPVEAFITTTDRTFLEYLAGPITKTLRRSMRES